MRRELLCWSEGGGRRDRNPIWSGGCFKSTWIYTLSINTATKTLDKQQGATFSSRRRFHDDHRIDTSILLLLVFYDYMKHRFLQA